jgi:tetratricopeptide (TPR) repeat protein
MLRTVPILLVLALSSAVASHGQKAGSRPASMPTISDPSLMSPDELVAAAEQLFVNQQVQEAVELLEAALKRDPKNLRAMVMVGEYNEALGDLNPARDKYLQVLRVEPENLRANLGLGRVFLASPRGDQAEQAIHYLEIAEKVAPPDRRSEALGLLARAYRGAGSRAKAVQMAQAAVSADPQNFDALQTLIVVRTELGQYDQAAADSQALMALALRLQQDNPNDPLALRRLRTAFDLYGWSAQQKLEAIGVTEADAQERPTLPAPSEPPPVAIDPSTMTIDALLTTAKQMFDARQYQNAAALLDVALRRDPKYVPAIVLAGEFAEGSGDLVTARTQYQRALDSDSTNFRANLGYGRTWLAGKGVGQARDAVRYLEQADRVAPADRRSEVLGLLARAYQTQGSRTLALDAAQRAIDQDPKNFDAWDTLVTVRAELGQYDQAVNDSQALVDVATAAARSDPADITRLMRLDKAYDARQMALKAAFRSLHVTNAAGIPTDRLLPGKQAEGAAALTHLIDTMLRQAELKALIARFDLVALAQAAVQYEPRSPQMWIQYGTVLRGVHRDREAALAFQKVLEFDAGNVEARRQLEELGVGPETAAQPSGTR